MDACLGYLHEIDVLLESYQELPLYQEIFEVADPEMGAISAKNAEIEDRSVNLLQKAINAIREIFKRIKEMIKTIFTWFGMSKDEKTAYQEFVKQCKSDPELAKKKVTIHDFRKINDEYNKDLKMYEDQYKSEKDKEAEIRPNLITDVQKSISNLGKKAANILAAEASSFTVESALTYAKACQENAAKVDIMLNFDMGLLDEIEKELGKKEVKKFKRKIKMLSSRHKFIRALAGGRQQQIKTLKDSIQETLTNVRSVLKVHNRAGNKNSAAHEDIHGMNKTVGAGVKGVAKFGVKTGETVLEKRSYAKKAYKSQMKKEKNTVNAAHKEALKENKRYAEKGI